MILHTVNKPCQLGLALRLASDGDCLLLIEDGVYAAMSLTSHTGSRLYVLAEDAEARAIEQHIPAAIARLDYRGFVELACRADIVNSWF